MTISVDEILEVKESYDLFDEKILLIIEYIEFIDSKRLGWLCLKLLILVLYK